MTRQRPKTITLTDKAANQLHAIMAQSKVGSIGLRVGVKNGGCAGLEYTMKYSEIQKPLDEIVDEKGIRIFIDVEAILFLIGTEIDYQSDKFSSGFKFKNPNQIDACGCGESVTIEPARIQI